MILENEIMQNLILSTLSLYMCATLTPKSRCFYTAVIFKGGLTSLLQTCNWFDWSFLASNFRLSCLILKRVNHHKPDSIARHELQTCLKISAYEMFWLLCWKFQSANNSPLSSSSSSSSSSLSSSPLSSVVVVVVVVVVATEFRRRRCRRRRRHWGPLLTGIVIVLRVRPSVHPSVCPSVPKNVTALTFYGL